MKYRCAMISLSLLLVFLAVPTFAAVTAAVTGKVVVGTQRTPVAGIRVVAYPVDTQQLRGEPPFRSAVTAEDGRFRIELPTGSYYFIARGAQLYCFYGRNPVTVPKSGLTEMNLALAERNPVPPTVESRGRTNLLGQLTYNGEPLEGAVVTVYTDLTSQLKGMGLEMIAPSDAQGIFAAEIPPGTYYLVARKRNSGALMGPLRAGDFFGFYAANPLLIRQGELARVAIAMLKVPDQVSRLADSLFGETSISGKIVDTAGQPVAGIRVLLYRDPMMLNRPLYVSQPSAADGRFILSFPNGGKYFLTARDTLGGPPVPGQMYGRYLGSRDGSVRLRAGQKLTGVELLVEPLE
ncbi:MAG: hypothetical protein GXP51_05690 [Deltaproteobacteria bacterium]|nr:hypothetical protein [Deltaproteobacteria bacterium]